MRRTTILLFTVFAVLAAASIFHFTPASVTAQKSVAGEEKFFLKIDGVDGEAMEGDHVGEILVHSFSWEQPRSLETSSRTQPAPFHIVIPFEKSIPVLIRKIGLRERIPKVTLTARNGTQDYLKWVMGDVLISEYQMEGSWGVSKPLVGLDLVFTKLDTEYRPKMPNGGLGPSVKGSWVISQ